jgi:hypothetical protein
MNPTLRTSTARPRRRGRLIAAGAVAAALSVVGGAGAAMAVAPTSAVSVAVSGALQEAGVSWEGMPDGYTQAQYEAFWGAGYSYDDVLALNELWSTGDTATKARAGQLILDGQEVPVAPSGPDEAVDEAGSPVGDTPIEGSDPSEAGVAYTPEQYEAFWGAGYTIEDMEALSDLWSTEALETKARAGQMILDGQTLPVAPGSTTSSTS